jgi:hypothetical protein
MMGGVFAGWEAEMRQVLLLGVFGLVGCESDSTVKVFNSPPAAIITSHDDGAEVKEAAEVIFRGVGSDPDHNQTELEGSWQLGADVLCDWAPLDEHGVNECTLTVTTELDGITFLVRDPKDSVGSTSIFLNITADADPQAEITSPSFEGRRSRCVALSAYTLTHHTPPGSHRGTSHHPRCPCTGLRG